MVETKGDLPLRDRIVISVSQCVGEKVITFDQFLKGASCSVSELAGLWKGNPDFVIGVLNTFGIKKVVREIPEENDILSDYQEREEDKTPKSLRAVSLSEWEKDLS